MKSIGAARGRVATAVAVMVLLIGAAAPTFGQQPVPTFSKAFSPSTMAPGSVATLRFDISNPLTGPVADLAFTDILPNAVVIAEPAAASTTCSGGAVSAPAGGSAIAFSGGSLGIGGTCSVLVNVTSATPGTHTNTSGDLTSSAGNSGQATADLVVDASRPGFSKDFSPGSVSLGSRSTLTFTIDNSANGAGLASLSFADNLPSGMVVADPANASTTCGSTAIPPTLTAAPGTGVVSLFANGVLPGFPALAAGAACTVSVDVIGGAVGNLGNVSQELITNGSVSSGRASAVLDVTATALSLVKEFTDDPVAPGGTVALEFTVTNLDRAQPATAISFTDDLDATLSGLVAAGLPASGVCGSGSLLSGTSVLSLTGGSLDAEGQCTFIVTLQVPAAAATGAYANTTSTVTADVAGGAVTGAPASDSLFVAPIPLLTKSFTDDPVGAGGEVTLEFTVTNSSPSSDATGIGFSDELTPILGFPVNATLPGSAPCGPGSTLSLVPLGVDSQGLQLSGGSLGPAASCTFAVTLGIPPGQPGGSYTNTTSAITATVGGAPLTGGAASDELLVVAGPALYKEFTDDPAQPGGSATLQFTITHDELAAGDATSIAFTDDLDAALSGLEAVGLPQNDICGAGSQLSGTSTLSFAGGTLAPGASCSFSVSLQVPAAAPVGTHTNTTSSLTATVASVSTTGNPAADDLAIQGLTLSKDFTDAPAFPGATVNLRFTIDNLSALEGATNISFQDDLRGVLSGLTAVGLPLGGVCGAGSTLIGLSGNTVLQLQAGSLGAGESCQFDVTLQVPSGAASGTYRNVANSFTASVGGTTLQFPNATDELVVSSDRLSITKSFIDDPVFPGESATLQFTITNLDTSAAASDIGFTDDLDAALAGLAAVGLPVADICGAGSQLSGTSVLTLTGGNLGPGGTCTFDVLTVVPTSVPVGSTITNTTSEVTGFIDGNPVTGAAASDDLLVNFFNFRKSFANPANPGGRTTLSFTIENLDASAGVAEISFTDDLDSVLAGLTAIGLPVADVCGVGSEIAGTSVLTLRDGTLSPGEACTFDVEVEVPASAMPGSFDNVTSVLFVAGSPSGEPATAALEVEAAAAPAIPVSSPLGSVLLILVLVSVAAWLLRARS